MEDETMKATTIAAQKIAMLAALAAARCEKYASAAPMPAMTRKISAESELLFLISNYLFSSGRIRPDSSRLWGFGTGTKSSHQKLTLERLLFCG
jgi:hypothetical protein